MLGCCAEWLQLELKQGRVSNETEALASELTSCYKEHGRLKTEDQVGKRFALHSTNSKFLSYTSLLYKINCQFLFRCSTINKEFVIVTKRSLKWQVG